MQEKIDSFREEIDTRNSNSPEVFKYDWLTINGLNNLKAVIRKQTFSANDKRIYLFGKHDDCVMEGAQIFIHLFELPKGKNELDKQFHFYDDQHKNFFLSERRKFDSSVLSLKNIPDTFVSHKAFQTKDGRFRKRIVHLYEYEHIALMIVYSLNSIEFIENSFFKIIAENIQV
ncbi:MAG TPA: hypothetical protein VIJ75_13270 [Hanamia sp.]